VQGSAWGLVRTVFFLVGATGSMFVGALADRGLFDESFYALAALTGVAALLFLRLPQSRSAGS
jgi:sugar phosphate permease